MLLFFARLLSEAMPNLLGAGALSKHEETVDPDFDRHTGGIRNRSGPRRRSQRGRSCRAAAFLDNGNADTRG